LVKAASHYKRVTELAPEDAPIWVDYGRVALDAGRTSEANLAFEQATLRAENENELRYCATTEVAQPLSALIIRINTS